MSDQTMDRARVGFEAWQRGDFDTLQAMFDPEVTWSSPDPGEGDCFSRADVMAVLRERHEQGFARGPLEFLDGGPDSIILIAHPASVRGKGWPEETATVVSFRDGKVVEMRNYRTRQEALAALR